MDRLDTALATTRVPPFEVPWWLSGAHGQTVSAGWKPRGGPRGDAVRIPLESGAGTLAGQWHRNGSDTCVVFVHGLGGDCNEGFCVRGAWGALRRGYDALRVSMRGCGDSRDTAYPWVVHAGLATDIRAMAAWALARYARVHFVGFSMGGQNLLRAAGEWGTSLPAGIQSLVAVSAPLDMAECAAFSDHPGAAVWRRLFLFDLTTRFRESLTRGAPGPLDATKRGIRRVREWDQHVVAPLLGFRDADEYYRETSAWPLLGRIAAPTLLVHAKDDPLVTVAPALRLMRQRSGPFEFAISEGGGHCGFFGAAPAPGDTTRFWAEERALAFIARHDTTPPRQQPLPVRTLPEADLRRAG